MEFSKEPRLADPGLSNNADRLAATVFDLPQKIVQDRALALAVDKNGRARRRELAEPGAAMRNTKQAISRDRFSLALYCERTDRFDTHIILRQQASRLAEQDGSRFGGLL